MSLPAGGLVVVAGLQDEVTAAGGDHEVNTTWALLAMTVVELNRLLSRIPSAILHPLAPTVSARACQILNLWKAYCENSRP